MYTEQRKILVKMRRFLCLHRCKITKILPKQVDSVQMIRAIRVMSRFLTIRKENLYEKKDLDNRGDRKYGKSRHSKVSLIR